MKRVQTVKDKLPNKCMMKEASASGLTVRGKCFRLHSVLFATCTLLFILVLGFTFHAMGYNVWRLFVSWDDETMKMRLDAQGNITGQGYKNDMELTIADAFFQKLEELEIAPLLPSWMPEGFALERVESKIETEYYRWAVGIYSCGDRDLLISVVKNISKNPGTISSLEKDEREPDIFEQGGIKFYIMDNLSRSRAFWYDPPYMIDISGHVTREELSQMIDSIFERK
jgi:hypothetical protein